jgi:hypothetical protein
VQRFFPRRWFHRTGTGPPWLAWPEVVAFWSIFVPLVIASFQRLR